MLVSGTDYVVGMSKGSEKQRREDFDRLRLEMGRRTEFYSLEKRDPSVADDRLVNADGMMWMALDNRYGHHELPLMAEVAADFGVNDELTRLILIGKREPSKAFLDAVGYERVMLYRRKASP